VWLSKFFFDWGKCRKKDVKNEDCSCLITENKGAKKVLLFDL
jgi:hypothetical protein